MTPGRKGPRATAAPLVWWVVIVGVTLGAHFLGGTRLSPPPWSRPGRLPGWWQARGSAQATFSLLRACVVAGGCYLLGLGALGLLWQRTRWRFLFHLLGAVTTPALRAFLASAGVSGVALATLASGGVASATVPVESSSATAVQTNPAAPGPAPVLRYLPPSPAVSGATVGVTPTSSPNTVGVTPTSSPTTVAGHPFSPPETSAPALGSPAPLTGPSPKAGSAATPRPAVRVLPARRFSPSAPKVSAPPAPERATMHTVLAGESLWSIAEATLTHALGHEPAPTALAQYWWQVVGVNRAHLPDPANPDLIFPGDQIVVPPPPAPGAAPSN